MRALRILLEKEFRQTFRNPAILRLMFMMPAVQLLIMPLAADYEIKNIRMCVVDSDHSTISNRLIHKITSSGYFKLVGYEQSYTKGLELVEDGAADLILQIPHGFERNLVKEHRSELFIALNAIDGVKAGLGGAYLNGIISDFNKDVNVSLSGSSPSQIGGLTFATANWFNPHLNYRYFMVPGILVILLTMVGAFLSSLNIVKEKETGTIEQINVTPIGKSQFILGKLIPFWVLGLVVLTIGLTIARLVYGIVPQGSLLTIYVFAGVYLFAVLGLGLLMSTFANTQQQAMLVAFFVMMVFILLGGLFTSIDSMPGWAQIVTRFNPVAYFIEVMRMVILKGSSLADISRHLGIVAVFGVVLNGLAVWNYRKRS
jgi:ABC-2 type transport system permease protein